MFPPEIVCRVLISAVTLLGATTAAAAAVTSPPAAPQPVRKAPPPVAKQCSFCIILSLDEPSTGVTVSKATCDKLYSWVKKQITYAYDDVGGSIGSFNSSCQAKSNNTRIKICAKAKNLQGSGISQQAVDNMIQGWLMYFRTLANLGCVRRSVFRGVVGTQGSCMYGTGEQTRFCDTVLPPGPRTPPPFPKPPPPAKVKCNFCINLNIDWASGWTPSVNKSACDLIANRAIADTKALYGDINGTVAPFNTSCSADSSNSVIRACSTATYATGQSISLSTLDYKLFTWLGYFRDVVFPNCAIPQSWFHGTVGAAGSCIYSDKTNMMFCDNFLAPPRRW
jgi:hypothetical protein